MGALCHETEHAVQEILCELCMSGRPSTSAGGSRGESTMDMPAVPTRCRGSCSPGTVLMDEVVRSAHMVGSCETRGEGTSNEKISRRPCLACRTLFRITRRWRRRWRQSGHRCFSQQCNDDKDLAWKSGNSPCNDGHNGIVQFRIAMKTYTVDYNAMAKFVVDTSRNIKAGAFVTVPGQLTETTIKVARPGV